MSINLNNFSISSGMEFFAKSVRVVTDMLSDIAFPILDGATTGIGQLLPDYRPTSVGDVINQAIKNKSALLDTSKGDFLIEITRDDQGCYIFQATGESLKPVVIKQGKRETSFDIWKVQVSAYLNKVVTSSSLISYGNISTRWKKDGFTALKDAYIAENLWKATDKGIELSLPEERPLVFSGQFASLKAEIVLKHFYQRRKTPIEEEQGKVWGTLSNLFAAYMCVSGSLLAPWVRANVMLPHQKAELDLERANRITADGHLSSQELVEMSKNQVLRQQVIEIAEELANQGDSCLLSQLENVSFQPKGYTQHYEYEGVKVNESYQFTLEEEVYARKECSPDGTCTQTLTKQSQDTLTITQKADNSSKVLVETFARQGEKWKLLTTEEYEASLVLSLPDTNAVISHLPSSQHLLAKTASVSVVLLATYITNPDAKVAAVTSLMQLISPSLAVPVSHGEVFKARDIKAIRSIDVFAISGTSPITVLNPQESTWIKPYQQFSSTINLKTDYRCSNPIRNLGISIQMLDGSPAPDWLSVDMGPLSYITSLSLGIDSASFIEVPDVSPGSPVIAIVAGKKNVYSVDISDRSNPELVGQLAYPSQFSTWGYEPSDFFINEDYAYILFNVPNVVGLSPLLVIDLKNPSNLTLTNSINLQYTTLSMSVANNTLYATPDGGGVIQRYDITNPSNITTPGVKFISCCYNGGFGFPFIGNYGYYLSTGRFGVVDVITDPQNPKLVAEVMCSTNQNSDNPVTAAVGNEDTLFVGTDKYVFIYDNKNQTKPEQIQVVFLGSQASVSRLILKQDYLYALCQNGGAVVIDIRNPQKARVVTSYDTMGTATDAVLIGNDLCLADGEAGVLFLDAGTRLYSGVSESEEQGEFDIEIIAKDDSDNTIAYPMILNVGVDTVPPIVINTLHSTSATINIPFYMEIPSNTFSGSNLIISAKLSNGDDLPRWLKFNSTGSSAYFEGTPGKFDNDAFTNRQLQVEVTAKNRVGSTKIDLTITVQGVSFWREVFNYTIGFASAGISIYKGRKELPKVWNRLFEKNYVIMTEWAYVGKTYTHDIPLKFEEIGKTEVYLKGKLLTTKTTPSFLQKIEPLLGGENGQFRGTPEIGNVGLYTVKIYKQNGIINQRFDLIIKARETDQDPQSETNFSYLEAIQVRLAKIRALCFSKNEEDVESGKGQELNDLGSSKK